MYLSEHWEVLQFGRWHLEVFLLGIWQKNYQLFVYNFLMKIPPLNHILSYSLLLLFFFSSNESPCKIFCYIHTTMAKERQTVKIFSDINSCNFLSKNGAFTKFLFNGWNWIWNLVKYLKENNFFYFYSKYQATFTTDYLNFFFLSRI